MVGAEGVAGARSGQRRPGLGAATWPGLRSRNGHNCSGAVRPQLPRRDSQRTLLSHFNRLCCGQDKSSGSSVFLSPSAPHERKGAGVVPAANAGGSHMISSDSHSDSSAAEPAQNQP